jgi:hypothetical protein
MVKRAIASSPRLAVIVLCPVERGARLELEREGWIDVEEIIIRAGFTMEDRLRGRNNDKERFYVRYGQDLSDL